MVGAQTGSSSRGSIIERLQSNVTKLSRVVAGMTPTVAEYWIEAMERILDDMDCTPKQKVKGTVSLLKDESYRW